MTEGNFTFLASVTELPQMNHEGQLTTKGTIRISPNLSRIME